jgi:hypothetical protein
MLSTFFVSHLSANACRISMGFVNLTSLYYIENGIVDLAMAGLSSSESVIVSIAGPLD